MPIWDSKSVRSCVGGSNSCPSLAGGSCWLVSDDAKCPRGRHNLPELNSTARTAQALKRWWVRKGLYNTGGLDVDGRRVNANDNNWNDDNPNNGALFVRSSAELLRPLFYLCHILFIHPPSILPISFIRSWIGTAFLSGSTFRSTVRRI